MGIIRKMDEQTVQYIFSGEEIQNMGFSLDSLHSKDTGEPERDRLMNLLFDMAEKTIHIQPCLVREQAEFEFRKVSQGWELHTTLHWGEREQIDFSLPDSEIPEPYALMSRQGDTQKEKNKEGFVMAISFQNMENAITFSKAASTLVMEKDIYTGLLKMGKEYWMLFDSDKSNDKLQASLFLTAGEHNGTMCTNKIRIARLCECGKAIIEEQALENLAKL